jgi:transposase
MNEKRVTLTINELKRLKVVQEMEAGRMTASEGAEALDLSVRQVRRLKRAYREKGAAGLAHGNRGKASTRRTAEAIRKQVVTLATREYQDYNDQHFTEELEERRGIKLSRSTVRRIRRAAGQGSSRKRRAPKHRSRRERRAMEGMLLQTDGSNHDWLEGRGPDLTLIAYIDDATGEVPGAVFRDEEDAAGYMLALRAISQTHGLPLEVYADRHSIFQSPKQPTLEEQLAGKQPRSQFGRALDDLYASFPPTQLRPKAAWSVSSRPCRIAWLKPCAKPGPAMCRRQTQFWLTSCRASTGASRKKQRSPAPPTVSGLPRCAPTMCSASSSHASLLMIIPSPSADTNYKSHPALAAAPSPAPGWKSASISTIPSLFTTKPRPWSPFRQLTSALCAWAISPLPPCLPLARPINLPRHLLLAPPHALPPSLHPTIPGGAPTNKVGATTSSPKVTLSLTT